MARKWIPFGPPFNEDFQNYLNFQITITIVTNAKLMPTKQVSCLQVIILNPMIQLAAHN